MQRIYVFSLFMLALLSSAAWGQEKQKPTPAQQTMPPVQQTPSLKVRSIVMAPGRKSATIELINPTTRTVTAYAYAYDITFTDGQHSKGEHMEERIGSIVFAEAGMRPMSAPDEGPIQPGEVRSDVFQFGEPNRVADLAVTVEVVIYSDLTSESTNEWVLNNFIEQRAEGATRHFLAAEAIVEAMQDEHPVKSAHDRLLNKKHVTNIESDIQNLEFASHRTFANTEQERAYLAVTLAHHRSQAASLATHAKIVRHQ
jgi:hypothetical protein